MEVMIVSEECASAGAVVAQLRHDRHEVRWCHSGWSAIDAIRDIREPHVLLFDTMLPDMTAEQFCRALEVWAPRSITVPLVDPDQPSPDGIEAHLPALTMASLSSSPRTVLQPYFELATRRLPARCLTFGPLRIDLVRREVRLDEAPVALSPRQFGILCELCVAAGRTVSKAALLRAVWDGDLPASEMTLSTHVNRLRLRLVEGASTRPDGTRVVMAAVRGAGYRLLLARAATA